MSNEKEYTDFKKEIELLKKENQELKNTVENLTLMTNTINETFWLSSVKDNKLIYVSPSYEKMFGLSMESLFKDPKSWDKNIHPEDKERIRNAFDTKIIQNKYDEEFRVLRKDGKIDWVRDRAFPIYDESQNLVLIAGISQFITQKKEAEFKLKETTENLVQIMETTPSGILIIDENYNTVYANRFLSQLLSYSKDEIYSKNILEIISKKYYEKIKDYCGEVIKREDYAKHFEFLIKNKHEDEYWVDFRANKIHFNGQNCVLISFNDITKLKRAQHSVVTSRQNLFALLNNTDYSFILLNRNFQILEYNLAADKLFDDLTSLNLMRKAYFDNYLNEFEQSRFRKEFDMAINGKNVINERKLFLAGDKTVWVEERYYPAKDEEGEIFGIAYSVIDITERKQAEQSIMESKAYLKAIFESSSELNIFSLDNELKYTTFNGQHQKRMVELSNANIEIGTPFLSYIQNPISQEKFKINFKKALSGKEFTIIEKHTETEDYIYYENTYSPIYYSENQIEGIVVIVRDITEKILNQKKLEESQKELQELNISKDKFFSIIAHDLKSPLSGFIGISQDLSSQVEHLTQEDIREIATNMNDSAKNIYELLENLLEWSRTITGKKEVYKDNINPYFIANSLSGLFLEVAKKKNIEIINEFNQKDNLFGDMNMFNTIVRNLISNAIKFTPSGTIKVGMIKKDSMGIIYVKDSGVGMKEEIKNKLFKIDETVTELGTNKEKGTGLGLILCKEFVEKNDGHIWVESEIGKGSTFYFTFPLVME